MFFDELTKRNDKKVDICHCKSELCQMDVSCELLECGRDGCVVLLLYHYPLFVYSISIAKTCYYRNTKTSREKKTKDEEKSTHN